MATMGVRGAAAAPSHGAAGQVGAGLQATSASWASPSTAVPLRALYAWYSGNAANGKTNGEGVHRRMSAGSELHDAHEGAPNSVEPEVSGLSGLSSLFDGAGSPAEVEAAVHREAMRAAAAAAAAMGAARDRAVFDPAAIEKQQDRVEAMASMAESRRAA
jgi:hypothetical protein